MQNPGSARGVKEPYCPQIVVAGEFSAGKSSLINLLVGQHVLQPSIGLSQQPPVKLRYAPQQFVNAYHRDGQVYHNALIEQATTNPDVLEVELYLPFNRFPGVEIQELPSPVAQTLPEPQRLAAANADLFIWCTIGSQAWRLSEKDFVASLGRRPDQPTILAVMRDDLIRTDSDRAKISRRLETEARPFFNQIVFTAASKRAIKTCAEDASAWEASGAGTIGHFIAQLPGAGAVPDQQAFPDLPIPAQDDAPPEIPNLPNVVPILRGQEPVAVPEPEPEPAPAPVTEPSDSGITEDAVQSLMETALDILLGAVGGVRGFRHAAVVVGRDKSLSHSLTAVPPDVSTVRAFYFAYADACDESDALEEIIIRGREELHLLWAIDGDAHLHLVMDPAPSTLTSVKVALREVNALGKSSSGRENK